MRLTAALTGNLEKHMKLQYVRVEQSVHHGVKTATYGLQGEFRGQVRSAGLGRRLEKAWRAKVYPTRGVSANAAGTVWSKAAYLMRVFDEGATIRSGSGVWLAIPSDAAPARGVGKKRLTPSNFPEHIYGPLRFVYRKNAPSMLVVDNQRVRGGKKNAGKYALSKSKRALKTGYGLSTVPMFFLHRQVRLKKRLDLKRPSILWGGRVPGLIVQEFNRLDRKR